MSLLLVFVSFRILPKRRNVRDLLIHLQLVYFLIIFCVHKDLVDLLFFLMFEYLIHNTHTILVEYNDQNIF